MVTIAQAQQGIAAFIEKEIVPQLTGFEKIVVGAGGGLLTAKLPELMDKIADKKDDIKDAEYKQWLSTSIPKPVAGDTNTVEGVTWVMPISYTKLTSPFGYRWHPISGKWKMHKGVDLAAPTGTKIVATRSGYVSVASYEEDGAGWYVQINHGDGYKSIYMHMTHFIVKVGQYVNAGDVIGYCGSTGGSTGNHLHFGIAKDGTYMNPRLFLDL